MNTVELITIILISMLITLLPIGGIAILIIYRSSFKNIAFIARQAGKDTNDVIWIRDFFKVKYVQGHWIIKFRRIKEQTQSLHGGFWTKFLHKKHENQILKYTPEQWESLEMRRHIRRGIYFYETTEGEFYPMIIKIEDKIPTFSVVNQNNRQFITWETQDVNNLTRNRRRETVMILAIIIGIIVLGAVFLSGGYFSARQHEKSVAATTAVSIEYAKAVYNITCNGQNNFIGNIKAPGG